MRTLLIGPFGIMVGGPEVTGPPGPGVLRFDRVTGRPMPHLLGGQQFSDFAYPDDLDIFRKIDENPNQNVAVYLMVGAALELFDATTRAAVRRRPQFWTTR